MWIYLDDYFIRFEKVRWGRNYLVIIIEMHSGTLTIWWKQISKILETKYWKSTWRRDFVRRQTAWRQSSKEVDEMFWLLSNHGCWFKCSYYVIWYAVVEFYFRNQIKLQILYTVIIIYYSTSIWIVSQKDTLKLKLKLALFKVKSRDWYRQINKYRKPRHFSK